MKYLHSVLFICVILSSLALEAYGSTPSAYRNPHKSYQEYLQPKVVFGKKPKITWSVEEESESYSEGKFKEHADRIDFKNHDRAAYREAFEWVRDHRFLTVRNNPSFQRRISWQYPDDGCFARAELATRKMKENGFDGVKKIFVFGDLETDTPNSADGFVTWWFHVAPIVKVDSEYMVFDPAISPDRMINVREWLQAMNRDYDSVQLSVCHESAYDPASPCNQEHFMDEEEVLGHQSSFLNREWFRMVELGRDPAIVLGDFPPWGNVRN